MRNEAAYRFCDDGGWWYRLTVKKIPGLQGAKFRNGRGVDILASIVMAGIANSMTRLSRNTGFQKGGSQCPVLRSTFGHV